jgi:hypothetical protein
LIVLRHLIHGFAFQQLCAYLQHSLWFPGGYGLGLDGSISFPRFHRACFGGTRFGSTDFGRPVLSDIPLLVRQVQVFLVLDRWLYVEVIHISLEDYSDLHITDANTISNVASVASIEWGCAVQIMAGASIGTGFETTDAQTLSAQPFYFNVTAPLIQPLSGVYCALIVVHGIINTFRPKVIARLQALFIALNVV